MTYPEREVRAVYTPTTIRVYQAYSHEIADSALAAQTFVSPPFNMNRFTWIKPSFLWMMYRAGWGRKDNRQVRILAVDITHEGFAWALANSCPTQAEPGISAEGYAALKERCPVRVQWDPERDLHHNPLPYRAIQVGLKGEAVERYVKEWIKAIEDITPLAHAIEARVNQGDLDGARAMLPDERPYQPPVGGT
jgi:hypothetical protein